MKINANLAPEFIKPQRMAYPLSRGLFIRYLKDSPVLWRLHRYYTEKKFGARYKDHDQKETFLKIFHTKGWKATESISGRGSIMKNTGPLIRKLRPLLDKHSIKCLLDTPCGDFNWMQHVDLQGITYIGGDIVPELIEANAVKYTSANVSFRVLDICRDELPAADLILVRDCLVHFRNAEIRNFLRNLIRSDIKYLLTTSFPLTKHNYDITTGNWRPVNLSRPPYGFPEPLDSLCEETPESSGQFPDKSLLLWKVSDLHDLDFVNEILTEDTKR